MSDAARTARPGSRRTALVLAAGAVVAVAANAVVASAATAAGASEGFGPLTLPALTTFTLVGGAVAHLGWRAVRARAADPSRALAVLVPVLTALSFVPDAVLLATGFVPGSSPTAVVALAVMHLVVVAVVVPVSRAVAPLGAAARRTTATAERSGGPTTAGAA